jgi:hypothetical protein
MLFDPNIKWNPETKAPALSGWCVVMRKDGTLCMRAYGNGLWWIPLADGWLSGIPAGFKWFGPVEEIDWATPMSKSEQPVVLPKA